MRKNICLAVSCALLAIPVLVLSFTNRSQAAGNPFLRTASTNPEERSKPAERLSKDHGPWMIMVCSFNVSNFDHEQEQWENAEKAAHELVNELRSRKIPAFIYSQNELENNSEAIDRAGRKVRVKMKERTKQLSIVAGNFSSMESRDAQDTLKKIKKMNPPCLKNADFFRTPSRQTPLSGAFLTVNPLLTPQEVANLERKTDPLLLKLNSGSEYSLLKNPGKYTLVIATFMGHSQSLAMNTPADEVISKTAKFDEKIRNNVSLDNAGYDAWSLVKTMRSQNMDAYVYHDRYQSVVTVGSFSAKDDPRMIQLAKNFAAKMKKVPKSQKEVLVAETIKAPGNQKTWIMDPEPRPMEVPHIR